MAITRELSNPPKIEVSQPPEESGEAPVQIDGFNQVVQMLLAADPSFRDSLLARLSRRDPKLVKALRERLGS
jgi:hypothetical protein